MKFSLQVDTVVHEVDVDPAKPLLWVLREDLGLMQAKFGCGVGLCGACSLYVGDKAVRACSFPVSKVLEQKLTAIRSHLWGGQGEPLRFRGSEYRR